MALDTTTQSLIPNPFPGRKWKGQNLKRGHRNIVGLTTTQLSAIMRTAEQGDPEDFATVCQYMLRTDTTIRSDHDTLMSNVGALPVRFVGKKGRERSAEMATWLSASWSRIRHRKQALRQLMYGWSLGLSIGENIWEEDELGEHHIREWDAIDSQDIRLNAKSRTPQVRTHAPPDPDSLRRVRRVGPRWLDCRDEPLRWFVYQPGSTGVPSHLSGVLMTCAWPWIWEKWVIVWLMNALEREGSGMFQGNIPQNAGEEVRNAMLAALEEISETHAAVIEGEGAIKIIEASKTVGEAHLKVAKYFSAQKTRVLLGSTLVADAGDKGARSLGDAQIGKTVNAREDELAGSFAEALREGYAIPMVEANPGRWGNVDIADVPDVEIGYPRPKPIEAALLTLCVDTKSVTRNEMRTFAGLERKQGAEWEEPVSRTGSSSPMDPGAQLPEPTTEPEPEPAGESEVV